MFVNELEKTFHKINQQRILPPPARHCIIIIMLLSARLLMPVIQTTFLGAGLGLLYGGTKVAASQFGYTGKLDPKPEAFYMDKQATHLFIQLDKFRHYKDCDRHFRQALLYTDKLLFLEAQLANGMKPDDDDVNNSCGYIAQIRMSCAEFMAELPERVHPKIEDIVKELWTMLQVHMGNIMKLCDGEQIIEETALDREMAKLYEKYGGSPKQSPDE